MSSEHSPPSPDVDDVELRPDVPPEEDAADPEDELVPTELEPEYPPTQMPPLQPSARGLLVHSVLAMDSPSPGEVFEFKSSHAVPSGAEESAGQYVEDPSQYSATSHGPREALQRVLLGAVEYWHHPLEHTSLKKVHQNQNVK